MIAFSVYMRGISAANMRSLLNFMYRGEVNIKQSTITEFLATADDLQVRVIDQFQCKILKMTGKSVFFLLNSLIYRTAYIKFSINIK